MRIDSILEMLKENPKDSFLHFALAKEYEKKEDWESAIKEYEFIMNHDENYTGLYYHLCGALIETESDTSRIEEVFVKGIDVCRRTGDQHALAELQNLKINWELEG